MHGARSENESAGPHGGVSDLRSAARLDVGTAGVLVGAEAPLSLCRRLVVLLAPLFARWRRALSTRGAIGIGGLVTSGNELTHSPGSLTVATEAVLPSKGVIQPRPGQMWSTEYALGDTWTGYIDGDAANAASNLTRALYQWGSTLLINYTGSGGYKLAAISDFSGSSTRALVGSYAPPAPTTLRMKFAQLARSLYWTTDAGLYTVDSATGTARAAGVTRPRDFYIRNNDSGVMSRLSGNPSATGSWLAVNKAVAYRGVVGRKDANGVVKTSASNGRLVIVNPADVVVTAGNLVRATNVLTATVTAHQFRPGDIFALSPGDSGGGADIAAGNYTVDAVTSTTIVFTNAGTNGAIAGDQTFSSGTKSVLVSFALPDDATAGDFVQLYRTESVSGATVDPGDECFLCYERILTAADISAVKINITDTTPDSMLGEALPSNANSGEGLLGINEKPPLCRDVCVWDGRMWGGETTDRHRTSVRLLGCGSPNGLQNSDNIAVNTVVFVGGATITSGVDFEIHTEDTYTKNVEKTLRSLALPVSFYAADCYATSFWDGTNDLGKLLIDAKTPASTFAYGSSGDMGGIYLGVSRASAWGEALPTTFSVTLASTARTSTTTVTVTTGSAHGFAIGDVIILAIQNGGTPDANFALGKKTIATVPSSTTFTYLETGSNSTLTGDPHWVYKATYKSDTNRQPVRFTRQGIPDAWPLLNTLGGLPDGTELLRITPLSSGDGLCLAFKNGGFYTVSGQYPYAVRRLDDTADLVAADSLVSHAGKLHGLTTQGVCAITEAGVGIVGSDIEDDIRRDLYVLRSGGYDVGSIFGVSNEADRQYLLYVPVTTGSGFSDKAHVYHSLSGGFTRWDQTRGHGIVWRGTDELVLGDPVLNQLRVARRNYGTGQYAAFGGGLYLNGADQYVTATVNGSQSSVSTITVSTGAWSDYASAGAAAFIGGVRYRITATTSNSITISGTVTVAHAQAVTIYVPFSPTIAFVADAAQAPGIDKVIREVQLHFGYRHIEQLSVTFYGEKFSTGTTVTVSPSDYSYSTEIERVTTIRVDVPLALRRSAMLRVSVTATEARGFFSLLGYSLTGETVSERTGK